jgi:hypothetical protein
LRCIELAIGKKEEREGGEQRKRGRKARKRMGEMKKKGGRERRGKKDELVKVREYLFCLYINF